MNIRINHKYFYILIALLLAFFWKEESLILNIPFHINSILCILSLCFSIIYFYFDREEKIGRLITSIVISFILFIILKTAFIFFVKHNTYDHIQVGKFPIDNFISGRTNMLYFRFKNKRYSIRYKNPNDITRENLMRDYELHLFYEKSFGEIYVIKEYKVVPKR